MNSQDELDEIIMRYQQEVQAMIEEFYATWTWQEPYYIASPVNPGVQNGYQSPQPPRLGLPGR